MSTPLESPLVRYGIGLSGALVIVFVGVFFLEGVARYVAFAIAVLDAVLTPRLLETAMASEADGADSTR